MYSANTLKTAGASLNVCQMHSKEIQCDFKQLWLETVEPYLKTFSETPGCGGNTKHTGYRELFYPGKDVFGKKNKQILWIWWKRSQWPFIKFQQFFPVNIWLIMLSLPNQKNHNKNEHWFNKGQIKQCYVHQNTLVSVSYWLMSSHLTLTVKKTVSICISIGNKSVNDLFDMRIKN